MLNCTPFGKRQCRCIRRSRNSAAVGYLLNPLLHRSAKPVRIPDKVHWTVARISITIAHREIESLFSLSLSLSLFFFLSTLAARQLTDLRQASIFDSAYHFFAQTKSQASTRAAKGHCRAEPPLSRGSFSKGAGLDAAV